MLAEMMEDMKAGDELTLNLVRINTQNWTQETFDVTVKLVEDRGNTTVGSGSQNNSESNNGGSSDNSDDLEKYFEEYFKKYYGNGN